MGVFRRSVSACLQLENPQERGSVLLYDIMRLATICYVEVSLDKIM